jgi:hypothetical protein
MASVASGIRYERELHARFSDSSRLIVAASAMYEEELIRRTLCVARFHWGTLRDDLFDAMHTGQLARLH